MGKAFISYSREDEEKVKEVLNFLSKASIEFFRDVEKISAGENWLLSIEEEINSSFYYVIFISENFYKKPNSVIHDELSIAIDCLRNKHEDEFWLYIVLLDDSPVPNNRIDSKRRVSDYTAIRSKEIKYLGEALVDALQNQRQNPALNLCTITLLNGHDSAGSLMLARPQDNPNFKGYEHQAISAGIALRQYDYFEHEYSRAEVEAGGQAEILVPPGEWMVAFESYYSKYYGQAGSDRAYNISNHISAKFEPGKKYTLHVRKTLKHGGFFGKRENKNYFLLKLV